ncbi:LARGE xylosyl- and glucuronyltransferase 2 [Agrilus planipennis]|uniref:LARGE xylosyl- and glucuronyltransferase 2 n=1 Tax=Agrilus planipennis TaxID=224129 RepID=A0A1W4XGB3_AGRPL|nr:LARGE xylosyl- and glucuronyltransferase 2 [Agrilus planipennis]
MHFGNSFNSSVIGLVENQSSFYLGKGGSLPWPAKGKGYNSGVILYHLSNIKSIGWKKIWKDVTKSTASFYGATKLADQDVFNAVIKQYPQIVYEVPCEWNTQLSDHTESYLCYSSKRIKILHWNSPKKMNVVGNKDGDYFRSIHKIFVELNGDLLRLQLHHCPDINQNVSEISQGVCYEFEKVQNEQWRTFLFFKEYQYVPLKNDVTFVTQLSYDRLQLVEELSKYWEGPISLTLYVTDVEFEECIKFISSSEILKGRQNIAYHAVFKKGEYYPINELRNVGLEHVNTLYVFLADIDFIPASGLYYRLVTYFKTIFKDMDKKALVVPAFETQKYRSKIPKTKRELIDMLNNKSIFTFRFDVWPVGQAATNFTHWKNSDTPYKITWQPDFEPYIVVKKDVVKYDRRFLGFGWNKVSHIMELEAQNYEFHVLPDVFIVHKPHLPSHDIGKFRNSPVYRMCLQNLKDDFIKDLQKKYGRNFDYTNGLKIT